MWSTAASLNHRKSEVQSLRGEETPLAEKKQTTSYRRPEIRMHHSTVVLLFLQTLACLLLVEGQVHLNQTGCYKTNITLNCAHYLPSMIGSSFYLQWYVSDTTVQRLKLFRLKGNGDRKPYDKAQRKKPELMKRLTLHKNGSLEISSLHHDDEAEYECLVKPGLKTHRIHLSVACGQETKVERKVCVEEDVALDCDAKHRTNPRKLGEVSWKKGKVSKNGSKYTKDKSFQIHSNHSLILPKGRPEGNQTFRCKVSKKDGSRSDEHYVKTINVKCYEDTLKPLAATVKTTQGRVAMTTATPTKDTAVTMETTSGETQVCGGILNNPAGSFQSPNFPSAYPANSHCKWTISLPQDYAAINFTLVRVNLEEEENCQNDYITIHDELANQIGCRICGTHNIPRQIQVKGKVAVVKFHSDSYDNKSGFKITYKAIRKSVL